MEHYLWCEKENESFLETMISLEFTSSKMNPFIPGLYPKKAHFRAKGSNFNLLAGKVVAYDKQPKTLRMLRSGS
jgi:hypothetical protein